MTVTIDRDLTSATWEQLAELVGHADETVMAVALAEGERRDRAERYRVKAQAKRRAFYEEWREAAHSSYLAAKAYTNGYMLSDVGKRTVTDPFSLWSGPEKRAMILASEEMREFWLPSAKIDVHGMAAATFRRIAGATGRIPGGANESHL